jgi:tetratricopeptide (TPR) repeat protein
MNVFLCACTVTLLLTPSAEAQSGAATAKPAGQSAVEQELIRLDKQFDEARLKGNTAAVQQLLTDDFLRVTGAGAVQSKSEMLKDVATQSAQPGPPQDAAAPTYTVQVHGDTALMAHTQKGDEVGPGAAVMHVFLKQQGQWKMAAWGTAIARPTTEQGINAAGYGLIESGKLQDAIELLKMNVRLFPQAWNTYDSLGEAYAKAGQTALAVQNYEKSIQLNPKNDSGKAALAKLKGK